MENIKALGSPEVKEALAKYSHYLVEARKKIIFTLIVFVLATFVGFFFYEQIIKFLVDFLSLTGINIVFTSPFQFINLAISCGVATGIIFSFPLLVFQIMSFLKPALRGKEYKMIMARVKAMPEDYQFVFKKIQHYMFSRSGGDGMDMLKVQYELIELFEAGVADGKRVLEITGEDVADQLMGDAIIGDSLR